MSESAPPQEQDERLWDVHCSFCGDVSRAWKRQELAVFELKDHIAYHVQGITIDAHVPSAPPQEPQEQERAEWTEADLGTMQSALTLLEDAYAPCDADCECILHPLRSLVSRLPTLPAPPPPSEVEEPRLICRSCGATEFPEGITRDGGHVVRGSVDDHCGPIVHAPSQSTGDAPMSVDEARKNLLADIEAVYEDGGYGTSLVEGELAVLEAAIREETRAHLEASEQRATQWGKENVRLQDELQRAKDMLTEAERQRHFWSRESLRHETRVAALQEVVRDLLTLEMEPKYVCNDLDAGADSDPDDPDTDMVEWRRCAETIKRARALLAGASQGDTDGSTRD